ncbi:MAG: energy-coupling factor transporter transmembrane component T [Andreesenia angusta]|nr:energy-coupling factor transporter transmembrane component T [Andreesenia angusta]
MDKSDFLNPTPISKIIVVLILSFGLSFAINETYAMLIVVFISIFFLANSRMKTAISTIIFYVLLIIGLKIMRDYSDYFILNNILFLLGVIKLFFLPLLASRFLISTSEVSSLIVSFEKMRFPKVIVIPLAVMFRYFPAFQDDRKHIKMAMKMRGISFRNPIRYLEYISVPILISASNIGNDISMSAETKCISDPCEKTRYYEVKFGTIDFIYVFGIIALYALGRIYA